MTHIYFWLIFFLLQRFAWWKTYLYIYSHEKRDFVRGENPTQKNKKNKKICRIKNISIIHTMTVYFQTFMYYVCFIWNVHKEVCFISNKPYFIILTIKQILTANFSDQLCLNALSFSRQSCDESDPWDVSSKITFCCSSLLLYLVTFLLILLIFLLLFFFLLI